MSALGLRIERLEAHHHGLAQFESGNSDVDTWIRSHALDRPRRASAMTFLLLRGNRIVGYFDLTMGSVLRSEATPKLVRGLPATPVGAVLLTRLAVDAEHQGQGLGAFLLAEALRKAVVAGDPAGARLVVVVAADETGARFYAHHGFAHHGFAHHGFVAAEYPQRLYRRVKDIRASLEAALH